MKHRLSFAYFNKLAGNILEIVVDDKIEISLEMIEECHQFITDHFPHEFGLLINRVNNYTYSYEAKLSIASHDKLKAMAFVYYSQQGKLLTEKLTEVRANDAWNWRIFSGVELGWQQAYSWLQQEMMPVRIG
jgi:hypothetical protein